MIIKRTFLSVTESNGIRNIKLQDHKTRNSLSFKMMDELIDAIKSNEDDKSLRVIVLSADGSIFSAGHNLKELSTDKGYDNQKKIFDKCHDLMKTIIKSQVPIISKVDGLAAGKTIKYTTIRFCFNLNLFQLLDYNLLHQQILQFAAIKVHSVHQEVLLVFSVPHLESHL